MTTRRRRAGTGAALLAAVLMAAPSAVLAQGFPRFTNPVVDQAGAVPEDVEQRVNASLVDYQARSGNQVAVAVVRTTGDRSIEDYSIDLAREWGVGQEGQDNGVLLVIAHEDRRLRIEVGRGLEGTLTDLESGRIIRDRLVPLLRSGDVGAAVEQGAQAVRVSLGDPEVPPLPAVPRQEDRRSRSSFPWFLVVLPLFGLMSIGGRRRRRGWGGFGYGGPIIFGSGWGSSGHRGGGFGGGGGGFSGGGGGSFGGGGASGSW